MSRRSRRRIVGRWEQIEQEAREKELKDLEQELHGERKRARKPRFKFKRRPRRKRGSDTPDDNTENDSGNSSDG